MVTELQVFVLVQVTMNASLVWFHSWASLVRITHTGTMWMQP